MNEKEFDPTHVLVVGSVEDPTSDEIDRTNRAISAVLDHGEVVELRATIDDLRDDHSDVYQAIDEAFERFDGHRLRGELPECRPALERLLSIETFHRFVTVERVEVFVAGRTILRYVPDHRTFRIDASPVQSLEADIRDRIGETDAAILPAGELAEWRAGGTWYELSPPWLCIRENACYKLTEIRRITIDERDQHVELDWASPRGIIGHARRLISGGRPEMLYIDDERQFRDAADAFETIADRLEIPHKRT